MFRGGVISRNLLRTFILSALGPVALLVMIAVLGRTLGPSGLGTFLLSIGLSSASAPVLGLGLQNSSIKMVPAYIVKGQIGLLKGYILVCLKIILLTSSISILAILTVAQIANFSQNVKELALATAILLPLAALRLLYRSILVAAKMPGRGVFLDEILPPISVVFFMLFFDASSVLWILLSYAFASAAGVFISSWTLNSTLRENFGNSKSEYTPVRGLISDSLPLMIASTSSILRLRMDVLMLGPLSSLQQVGFYGGAARFAYAILLPAAVVSMVFIPSISTAFASGDYKVLRRYFRSAIGILIATLSLIVPLLIFFSDFLIIQVLGSSFGPAQSTFKILCIAYFFMALVIPCNGFLVATGHHTFIGYSNIVALVATITLNLVLIPLYGAYGASLSMLVIAPMLLIAHLAKIRTTGLLE